jgi:hypothetical protein
LRLLISLILATGAAYAFSFAADLLVGGLIGVYPRSAFLPAVTWSIISIVAVFIACAINGSNPRWLSIPYAGFGLLAGLAGAIGPHRYSLIVAILMFLHGYLLWRSAPPAPSGRT